MYPLTCTWYTLNTQLITYYGDCCVMCNSTQDKDHDDDYQEFFPNKSFGQNFLIRGEKGR